MTKVSLAHETKVCNIPNTILYFGFSICANTSRYIITNKVFVIISHMVQPRRRHKAIVINQITRFTVQNGCLRLWTPELLGGCPNDKDLVVGWSRGRGDRAVNLDLHQSRTMSAEYHKALQWEPTWVSSTLPPVVTQHMSCVAFMILTSTRVSAQSIAGVRKDWYLHVSTVPHIAENPVHFRKGTAGWRCEQQGLMNGSVPVATSWCDAVLLLGERGNLPNLGSR